VGIAIFEKKEEMPIDATVATAYAGVTQSQRPGNIGGGGFIVFMKSDWRGDYNLILREKAPSACKFPPCF